MSLSHKTALNIIWNFAEQLARKGIAVLTTMLLAHFLTPSDFGLVSMMTIFLALGNSLMESGFKQALIRLHPANSVDFDTAFISNVFLGLLSYVILFFSAPFIASFYHEDRLIDLIRVASLSIPLNSLQIVQVAKLSCELNFRSQVKATVVGSTISSIASIIIASFGFGVWAIIYQTVLSVFFTTVYFWYSESWKPSFVFSLESFKKMYGFGYKLFLSGLLDTIFNNIYVVVIAKIFSSVIAGHFFFAEKVKQLLIAQIVNAVQTASYPSLSLIQNDDDRLKNAYRKLISVTMYFLTPILISVALLSENLFRLFLSDQWIPSVQYLKLMCISGLAYPLHSINLNVLKLKGRADLFLYLEIVKKVLVSVVLLLTFKHGVIAILVGQIITSVIAYFPNSYFTKKLINYSVLEQFIDFFPCLFLSFSLCFTTYFIINYFEPSDLIIVFIYSLLILAFYPLLSFLFKIKAFSHFMEFLNLKGFVSKRRP